MQIQEIRVHRFGPWRDLRLSLPEPTPLAVLVGRNEAGKSTLARFVRWVLFGSPPQEAESGEATLECRAAASAAAEHPTAHSPGGGIDRAAGDPLADGRERIGVLRVRFDGHDLAIWRSGRDGVERWGVVPAETREADATAARYEEAEHRDRRAEDDGGSGTVPSETSNPEADGASAEPAAAGGPSLDESPSAETASGPAFESDDSQNEPPQQDADDVTAACRRLRATLQRLAEHGAADACCLDLLTLSASDDRIPPVVHREVFDVALPPAARRVLSALDRADETLSRLITVDGHGGTLLEALRACRDAWRQKESFAAEQVHRWQTVTRSRQRRRELQDALRRREGLHHQLRGHRLLHQVWPLWNREQEIQRALNDMPALPTNHDEAAEQFRGIQSALRDLESQWRATSEQLEQARARFDAVRNVRRWLRARPAIERLMRQAERCEREAAEIDRLREQVRHLQGELQAALESLGPQWTAERVGRLNVSWGVHTQLLQVARDYEAELARQHRLRRRVSRLDRAHRRATARLQDACRLRGVQTLEQAAAGLREQIAAARERRSVRVRLHDLERTREQLIAAEQRTQLSAELPRWMHLVLGAFVAVGTFAMVAGLVTGLSSNGLAGLGYVFLGLTSTAMAWAWKRHLQRDESERWERLQQRVRSIDREILELRRILEQDTAPPPCLAASETVQTAAVPERPPGEPGASGAQSTVAVAEADADVDELTRLMQALAELETLQQRQRRVAVMRRRLVAMRQRLQVSRRRLTSARRRWFDGLQRLGIGSGELYGRTSAQQAVVAAQRATGAAGGSSEGLAGQTGPSVPRFAPRLKNAFAVLEHLGRAAELWSALQRTQGELARKQRRIEIFAERVAGLAARFHLPPGEAEPWRTVRQWSQRLQELEERDAATDEQRRALVELRKRRAALRQARRRLRKRAARLWAEWQARSEHEFWQNVEIARQRSELHEEWRHIREQLQQLAEQHSDLAITEDDLRKLDPEANAEQMRAVEAELQDTEADIREMQAECEALETQIAEFAGDLRGERVRFACRVSERTLRRALRDWVAAELARDGLLAAKAAVERSCQPSALRRASELFRRMTEGRYASLWVPLREHALKVDTAGGQTRTCEELSLSTRVLLQLALRLAVWRSLSESGIAPPLVLDGVCVAFDEQRLRAVAATLAEPTFPDAGSDHAGEQPRRGGAYVLTCHWGVAEAFSEVGAELAELPEPVEVSRSVRRAG